MQSACLHPSKRLLEVFWTQNDGQNATSSLYPDIWLRDNCQCSDCFHPTSMARMTLVKNLDLNDNPANIDISGDHACMTITWSSGHVSLYTSGWLWERRFADEVNQNRLKLIARPLKYWDKEIEDKIPSDTFDHLMEDNEALYNWLTSLEEVGIFLIKGAPQKEGILEVIATRVAFLRATNYGKTFAVRTKFDPSNLAYTTGTLGLHTDLAYYKNTPGMQMLHCIKQARTVGGENQFADGFQVAKKLKKSRPDLYNILASVPVDFYDLGSDYYTFYKLNRKPIISLDSQGEIERINYSNHGRDSWFSLPVNEVHEFYVAMKTFDDLLYDKENLINLKMEDGDVVCFHNYRVLHGRTGFEMQDGTERHLEGGYIDWDEMRSKRRVLEQNLVA